MGGFNEMNDEDDYEDPRILWPELTPEEYENRIAIESRVVDASDVSARPSRTHGGARRGQRAARIASVVEKALKLRPVSMLDTRESGYGPHGYRHQFPYLDAAVEYLEKNRGFTSSPLVVLDAITHKKQISGCWFWYTDSPPRRTKEDRPWLMEKK